MTGIIVSHEILLERIELSDAPVIFNAIDTHRDFLGKWLPFVSTTLKVEDSTEFVKFIIDNREQSGNEVYTIWYKGDFAGILGTHNNDKTNEKLEIGYWMIPEMTGRGIMTRTCKVLISRIFMNQYMNRITLRCGVGNISSENVAIRLGFQFEGIERGGERHGNEFLDLKVYSLLREDNKGTELG